MESHPNNQKYRRPSCDADWIPYHDEFVSLYMTQDKSLQHCRDYFKGKYLFDPSEKQWKNQIRKWKLRKYFKGDEAARVLAGTNTAITAPRRSGDPDEALRRAERSFKRKRARERSQADSQDTTSPLRASSTSSEDSHSPGTLVKLSPCPSTVIPRPTFTIRTHEEKLLFGIGQYVIDACGLGLQDVQALQPHAGRQAARSLSSDLAAGRSLFEKGKQQLAMNHWQRARSIFQNPNLLNAWYHETPIRLLFEIARMAHSGHRDVAVALLQDVRSSNEAFLDEKDPRYALFSTIGDLNVDHLRELHTRAAHCQYDTLAWRLEKSHERLYEVRLNRALDVLWFDPKADLAEWMSSIEEIDQNLGPNNAYSIYFLLLQAYRYVALEAYHKANKVCDEVTERLKSLRQSYGTIDTFRLGLAYRRLGRQMHAKRQFQNARQIMTKALEQLRNTEQRAAVLIEICQLQEAMARALNNEMEVMLWSSMLDQLVQQRELQATVRATTQPRKREREDDEYNCSTKRHRIEDVTDQPDTLNASNLGQPSYIEATVPMSQPETFNSGTDQPYPTAAPPSQQSFSSMSGMPDDRIGSFADIPFSRSNSGIDPFPFFPGGTVYEEPTMEAGNTYPNYDGSPFQPNTNWTFGTPSMDFGPSNIVYSPSGVQWISDPPNSRSATS